jgi:hypothetical protein
VAGKPQNIEYRMTNTEGNNRKALTSSFEIPWSPLALPKAGKPCSIFDIQVSKFGFGFSPRPEGV